jgi:hypothetical protein
MPHATHLMKESPSIRDKEEAVVEDNINLSESHCARGEEPPTPVLPS